MERKYQKNIYQSQIGGCEKNYRYVGSINLETNNFLIYTTTFPCKISTFRIDGSTTTNETDSVLYQWYLMVVRQGAPLPNISFSGIGPPTAPEDHILSFGSGCVQQYISNTHNIISNEVRTLNTGDTIYFAVNTDSVNPPQSINISYTIHFCLYY